MINWSKQLRQLLRFLGVLNRPSPKPAPAPVEAPDQDTHPDVPATPSRPTDLRGQFVLFTRNPWHGDSRFPKALPDRFFMAELDAVWDRQPHEAERILTEYLALGCNHVTVGTIVDNGYHDAYPSVDWRGQPERYAEFLRWLLSHGVEFSLFALPDIPPYFLGNSQGWDLAAAERDLTPFFTELQKHVDVRRVVSAWEEYGPGANMVEVFRWLSRVFPNSERAWHNPVGHLSPCGGTEYQRGGMTSPEAWRAVAAAGCDALYLQAWPENMPPPDTDRTPLEQMRYDVWDMLRRFTGQGSPWGAPIVARDGKPLRLDFFEGVAYAQYWGGAAYRDIGPAWRQAALAAGARYVLDGAPR